MAYNTRVRTAHASKNKESNSQNYREGEYGSDLFRSRLPRISWPQVAM